MCVGIIFCIPPLHGRRMDLRGFREIFFEIWMKKGVCSLGKKKEISSSHNLAARINFKPANDKPTTTPRASKKNGVEV